MISARRTLVVAVACLVAVAACAEGSEASSTTKSTNTSLGRGLHEETYVDTSRPTPPNGEFPGASSRTILVRFHVPRRHGPFPVVLWSPGFTRSVYDYDVLAEQFARRGYLMAVPGYPLSASGAPGGTTLADREHQPADASFVLDQILASSRHKKSWLYGLVDRHRIGTGGNSLGGQTALALFSPCCSDSRIRAVVAVAAASQGVPFTGHWSPMKNPPLLLVHGNSDDAVPFEFSQRFFDNARSPKYLLRVMNGEHPDIVSSGRSNPSFHYVSPSDERRKLITKAILAFFDAYLMKKPEALGRLTTIGNTPGRSVLQVSTA